MFSDWTRWSPLLGAWLLGACLGGQTGEPTSDHVDCVEGVPARETVQGVSPEQLALAYQGEHHAELQWASDPTTVTQQIALTITPTDKSGVKDACWYELRVPVHFSLVSADGSVMETGEGVLSAALGTLGPARFTARGQRFDVYAEFTQVSGALVVSGTLTPVAGNTNDTSGSF